MTEPWLSDAGMGLVGGLLGTAIGVFGGGIGAYVGNMAPQGKKKRRILSLYGSVMFVGFILLSIGIWAWIVGQPYPVCGLFSDLGGSVLLLFGSGLPLLLMMYRVAEERKMAASDL